MRVIALDPRALRNVLGTVFTYQGQLKDNGAAANGAYDFQFKLVGGGQVGSTFIANDVNVTNGYFTVSLDFGAAFDGSERDLEIAVRPGASTGAYTTLTPRQQLTATPYSLYAKNGWSLTGNNGTTAGTNFVGTTDNVPLELRVNNARVLRLEPNGTSPNVIGGHSGNNVTTNVFGATIAGGGTSVFTNRVTDNFGTVGPIIKPVIMPAQRVTSSTQQSALAVSTLPAGSTPQPARVSETLPVAIQLQLAGAVRIPPAVLSPRLVQAATTTPVVITLRLAEAYSILPAAATPRLAG